VIGLILTCVIRPGVGININTANLDAHALSA
jgi:Na+/H+-dicarboxylate symporter